MALVPDASPSRSSQEEKIAAGFELTHLGIISFLKDEGFSHANAESLGLYLTIPWPTMSTLKKNNAGNATGLFYDVIGSWIDLTKPTYEELAKALDKSDYKRIAEKIRESTSAFPYLETPGLSIDERKGRLKRETDEMKRKIADLDYQVEEFTSTVSPSPPSTISLPSPSTIPISSISPPLSIPIPPELTIPDPNQYSALTADNLITPPPGSNDLSYSLKLKEGHQLREYQKELAQPGIEGRNYIMIAPTGSGKTVVAAKVISHHLQEHYCSGDPNCSRCHVVFVVTTKPLAEQQNRELSLLIPDAKVDVYTGDTVGKLIADSIKENDITVCTAGKLRDEILKNRIQFGQFSLVILDECHHTKKNHEYAILMENYLEERNDNENSMPQVIGMTASPGAGENIDQDMKKTADHLKKLAALMDATSGLVRVTENIEELQGCSKSSSSTHKTLQPRATAKEHFITEVTKEMEALEFPDAKCSFEKWSQEYETKIQQLKHKYEKSSHEDLRDPISTLSLLCCYSNALSIYRDLRQTDAIKIMEVYIENEFPADDPAISKAVSTQHEYTMKLRMIDLVRRLRMLPPVPNPLLHNLERILCKKFGEDPSSRAIIFVRTKMHAFAMKEWLMSESDIIPDVLIGHTRDTEGMNRLAQEEVMSKFKEGKTNLLLATSVAEEGLDIPACNLVVRYLHVSNEIAMVQTQGRARSEDSDCYTILSCDSKRKYKEMKNVELNALVESYLESGWFPSVKHWQSECKAIQDGILTSRRLKASLKVKRKQEHTSEAVKLLCKGCKRIACCISDVYTIGENEQFHYVVPDPHFERDKITIKLIIPYLIPGHDDVKKTHKIYCSKCQRDWGVMCIWPTDGHQFPVIKCVSFTFKVDGRAVPIPYKKWGDVPYAMSPLSSWLDESIDTDSD